MIVKEEQTEKFKRMSDGIDLYINRFFDNVAQIRWLSFPHLGLNESFYSYYYAENKLYIIRDVLADQMFFVKADSPKDAFMKFHKKMEDALNAGRYVDGGEYDD